MVRNSEGLVFCHTLYAASFPPQVWLTYAGTRQRSSRDFPNPSVRMRRLQCMQLSSVRLCRR